MTTKAIVFLRRTGMALGAWVLLIDLEKYRTTPRPLVAQGIDRRFEPQKFGTFFREQEALQEHDHICIDLPGAAAR